MMQEARRHRKLFGGGMRQAGILAAAALYALEHHVERLADDHANAARLADAVREIPPAGAGRRLGRHEHRDLRRRPASLGTAAEFCQRLKERGLLMLAIGAQQVRAVTHLDVDEADTIRAGEILAEVTEQAPRGKVVAGQEVVY